MQTSTSYRVIVLDTRKETLEYDVITLEFSTLEEAKAAKERHCNWLKMCGITLEPYKKVAVARLARSTMEVIE